MPQDAKMPRAEARTRIGLALLHAKRLMSLHRDHFVATNIPRHLIEALETATIADRIASLPPICGPAIDNYTKMLGEIELALDLIERRAI